MMNKFTENPDEIVLKDIEMFHLESMNERALWVGVATFFLSMFYVFTRDDIKEPQKPQSNTEVVGSYKECEVIEYTNSRLANSHYLLYCGDQK